MRSSTAIEELSRTDSVSDRQFIESALDDPEHISLDGYPETLSEEVHQLGRRQLQRLIDSSENGTDDAKEGIQHGDCRKAKCRKILPAECAGRRRAGDCDGCGGNDAGCSRGDDRSSAALP